MTEIILSVMIGINCLASVVTAMGMVGVWNKVGSTERNLKDSLTEVKRLAQESQGLIQSMKTHDEILTNSIERMAASVNDLVQSSIKNVEVTSSDHEKIYTKIDYVAKSVSDIKSLTMRGLPKE